MGIVGMGSASNQLAYWQKLQQAQSQAQNPFALSQQKYMEMMQQLLAAQGLATPSIPAPAIDPKTIEALKAAEPRKVLRRLPDSVSMITAWRAWGGDCLNGEWRLRALGQNNIWEPKKRIEASCIKGQKHPAPDKSCECGIWAFKTLELLIAAAERYQFKVFGNVSLWGRIIETTNGFRAQFAYPKELWLIDDSLEQLGYIYGVPVRTIPKP